MNHQQTAWVTEANLTAEGVTEHHSYSCGCYEYQWPNSRKVHFCCPEHEEADRLKRNPTATPRHCPCGECDRLSRDTARIYWDREAVEQLRHQRWKHYRECTGT